MILNNNRKKFIIFVIILIIGLSNIPSIYANILNQPLSNEMIEYEQEIFGPQGIEKNRISINEEDAIEVEKLFNEIESKLNNAKEHHEIIKIYNEAIINLDKYGLLGDLTVEQTKELITSGYNKRVLNFYEKNWNKNYEIPLDNEKVNFLSFIWGTFKNVDLIPFYRPFTLSVAGILLLTLAIVSQIIKMDMPWGLLSIPLLLLYGLSSAFAFPLVLLNIFNPLGLLFFMTYINAEVDTFGLLGNRHFKSSQLWLTGYVGLVYRPLEFLDQENDNHLLGWSTIVRV